MNGKSTRLAIGGVFSAMCLLLMFMTGLMPFATYALPALAGAMLVAVVVENGAKTAVLVYVSVSILSIFIVPDREASMIFVVLLGYYPILKEKIERIRSRVVEYVCKLFLFNAAVGGSYFILTRVIGVAELVESLGEFGKYSAYILLAAGNVVFLLYDMVLTRYISLYIRWFRPTFLRR